MTLHKVPNHQFRPTYVKNMLITAGVPSLNCDETIWPSIYVSNQMHEMFFELMICAKLFVMGLAWLGTMCV